MEIGVHAVMERDVPPFHDPGYLVTVTSNWTETWPRWSDKPSGIIVRIVGALSGLTLGGILVFLAYFGATFKKTVPDWNAENLAILGAGVTVAVAWAGWALRPSRLTLAIAGVATLVPLVVGAIV